MVVAIIILSLCVRTLTSQTVPCDSTECCLSLPAADPDPFFGMMFDEHCPTSLDPTPVPRIKHCLNLTGCRYTFPCDTDECCRRNPIINPWLNVHFSEKCPQQNGDVSIIGCVEFTRCRYTHSGEEPEEEPEDSDEEPEESDEEQPEEAEGESEGQTEEQSEEEVDEPSEEAEESTEESNEGEQEKHEGEEETPNEEESSNNEQEEETEATEEDFRWVVGPWGKCEGGITQREVNCVNSDQDIVPERSCKDLPKPASSDACDDSIDTSASLSPGQKAGIVIGTLAGSCLLCALCFCGFRRKRQNELAQSLV